METIEKTRIARELLGDKPLTFDELVARTGYSRSFWERHWRAGRLAGFQPSAGRHGSVIRFPPSEAARILAGMLR